MRRGSLSWGGVLLLSGSLILLDNPWLDRRLVGGVLAVGPHPAWHLDAVRRAGRSGTLPAG
jgi:hypothetical protein